MKSLLSILFSIIITAANSQYYYNDLLSNTQSNKQYNLLRTNNIHHLKATSFDADNQPVKGFTLLQEFNSDFSSSTTTSGENDSTLSVLISGFANNKIISTSTSINNVETITGYTYDSLGRLFSISSSSNDTLMKVKISETHLWFYDAQGKPLRMLKIKNGTDTTNIDLSRDDQGNITEERWMKKGTLLETYYYYYNKKNQLTDIVRFNRRAQKLLPDFLFEYDDHDQVKQMIQVPAGNSNYFIWNYTYDPRGFKTEESCRDKSRNPLGNIVYSYN